MCIYHIQINENITAVFQIMITGGHIAASYLLAEGAKQMGIPLTSIQVLGVLLAGNIIDLDFLVGLATGKKGELHHQNITHTPLGVVCIWIGINTVFKIPLAYALVLLISLFVHLILDDLGYWIYKLNLHKVKTNAQINWLYPFTPFSYNDRISNNKDVLIYYLTKAWPVALLEVVLIVIALIIYVYEAVI